MEQRRRQAAESLRSHSLFGFQVHDASVAERLRELQELLLATCGERDQVALLSENVRELEEQLRGRSERFLLEPLRRFEQEMELLLDVASGEEVEEQDEELSDEEQECLSLSQDPLFSESPVLSPIETTEVREMEDEVLCGVCCAPDSLENDPIVICELCGVAVHQTCYRLAVVPDGDWYCHPCRQYLDARDVEKNVIPTHELECQACCTKAGAFAPTPDGGWVHVACSMFLPELYLQEKHTARFQGPLDDLQVVCGLDKLKARRRLRCCFCKKSNEKGACAQCAVGKCVVAYHALCALRNGIKLRYMQDKGQFGSGCLKHQADFLQLGNDSEIDAAVMESKDTSTAETNGNPKPRRIRKNSWSDEDDSESGDDNDDENDLDSDSEHDGSQDSLSDDDLKDEKAEIQSKPSPTKMSPPRLLGGPPIRKSGGKQGNRPRRNRQIKLSFTPAEETRTNSSRSQNPTRDAVASAANAVHTAPAPAQEAATIAPDVTKNGRLVLDTDVFAPACYPTGYKAEDVSEQEFEYVMVLITKRPLGLGIASSTNGPGMFLLAQTTTNPAVVAAIKQGVIRSSDEVFALNDRILRTMDMKSFKELVPSLSLPIRCWIRTKRKSKVFSSTSSDAASGVETPMNAVPVKVSSPPVPKKKDTVLPFKSPMTYHTPSEANNSQMVRVKENSRENDGGVISLGMDWPWVFLRSDGKLAMNLFWKSLDSAFFLRKINKRTFSRLQEQVEDMCGVRLSSSHAEYEQVRGLLVMPRRERVPSYLVEFRNTLKEKQKFLSSDVLMGVSSESKDTEVDVDEHTALEVGTTVSVAKRTWPGMNKLGGVGRIKKVNEEKLPDGRKRFTYNVTFVIGGFDKNVERKYISVVDLESEESNANEVSTSTTSSRRQKSEPESDVKDTKGTDDTSTVSLRLAFSLNRTEDEEKLAELQDASIESPPKRRRFQVQFSTENSTVYCERKHDAKSSAQGPEHPAKELLLHKHFEVKLAEVDALTNACFSSELLTIEDRVGDEVDDDDTDSEGERDEIKTELATLQQQFRAVMESNELAFASLTKKVDEEYASKEYRQQELQGIQWRNYERMYQELRTAKRQFDESDEDSDAEEDGRVPGSGAKVGSEEEADSEVEDISFGGMFVNKLKQEGSEVCALCELSGGDFTSTDTGSVVHPQCAMFTPETFFKDGVVHGIALVDPERKRLKCTICGGRKGLSKIQCAHRKCVRAYHVACAFVNGLLTRDPYYQAWCPRHLKTSGMGQFVDLPDHLSKKNSEETATATVTATPSTNATSSPARRNRKSSKQRSRQKKNRARQDSTPAEATTAARTDISSSKTNRKRRRKGSNASVTASASGGKSARGTRGSSPRSAIVIEEQEPRCARRLEIDEVSDDDDHEAKAVESWQQGRDPHHVFVKNDVVEVLARDWRGINKQGGVARVRAVEVVPNKQGGKDVFYDIIHIVGAFKEKRLPARFVRSYQSNAE